MIYEYWLAAGASAVESEKTKTESMYRKCKRNILYRRNADISVGFFDEERSGGIGRSEKELRLEETYRALEEHGIRFLPYFDKEYPGRLRKALSPPYALYVKGRLPEEEKVSVAIVGARKCTPYGEEMALAYGERLAEAGIQIISGMQEGLTERHREGR